MIGAAAEFAPKRIITSVMLKAEIQKTEKLEQILAAKKANLNNIHAKNDNLAQKIEALLA